MSGNGEIFGLLLYVTTDILKPTFFTKID